MRSTVRRTNKTQPAGKLTVEAALARTLCDRQFENENVRSTVKAALARKLCNQHFGNENVQSTVRRNQQKREKDDQ